MTWAKKWQVPSSSNNDTYTSWSTKKIISVEKNFWSKVIKTRKCWLWIAYCKANGYGQFFVERNPFYAHRVSWQLTYGGIPNGMNVLHKCDNPRCVRPSHLFLGTQRTNLEDMRMKGRQRKGSAFCNKCGAAKTIYKWGRECKSCQRIRSREWYRRNKMNQMKLKRPGRLIDLPD